MTILTRAIGLGLAASVFACTPCAKALEGDPYANEPPEQRDARMAWWRDAKFGMFIHWGVYAVPAGVYQGKEIPGIGEWIMLNAKIPVAEYRGFATQFNPAKYDPAAWAALAKEAGMRYMVITSKHHDGFTLYPSEASQWGIAGATPWKKDLIGPLAEAARAQGLKFGLYYSQAQDWVNPGGAKAGYPDGGGWDDAQKGSFDSYLDKVAVPQVREILTKFKPDVLWWDTPHLMTPQRAEKLSNLLAAQPGIITNNRLGGGYRGDTETPEQFIPAGGFPGRDWETCMTLNDTWGYKSGDSHWKSAPTLITNLVDIVSKGGNYLLNVGPNAEGEIPAESVRLLKEVGAWMKTNGESIYGTSASPFKRLPWGRSTSRAAGDETVLYLHVFDWPESGKLTVPGLGNEVKSATLLAGGVQAPVEKSDLGPVLTLPAAAPDPVDSVIKLVVAGKPQVAPVPVLPDKAGVIRLLPDEAKIEGSELQIERIKRQPPNLGYWNNTAETVSWELQSDRTGKFAVSISVASPGQGAIIKVSGAGELACSVPDTGSYGEYRTVKVGTVNLTAGAKVVLRLQPVAEGWHPVNIRSVELAPES